MKYLKVILSIIILLILVVVIFLKIPFSPEKAKFLSQMKERMDQSKSCQDVCTLEEIMQLPQPLQTYCSYIGLENFPKYQVVNVVFHDTSFVFNTESEQVITMDYDLWLFYDELFRSAFCSSSMFGIPFEGVDFMSENQSGGMKGFLAKCIPLFNESSKQGFRAGLISWFAESIVINPSVLFSPYVSFEEIDDTHVKATVTYQGVSGSGIITFNEEGAITEFYSDERQEEIIDGEMMKLGWKCYCENYEERNGIKMIAKVRSTKVFPNGKELVYFESDNFTVEYLK